jgi:hypothetical protein
MATGSGLFGLGSAMKAGCSGSGYERRRFRIMAFIHAQPSTTMHNHPQPQPSTTTTIQNHTHPQPQPSTTIHILKATCSWILALWLHAQPSTIIHNHNHAQPSTTTTIPNHTHPQP